MTADLLAQVCLMFIIVSFIINTKQLKKNEKNEE